MHLEQPAFSTLPGELVEEILIACAANNDAASVAAVAATSRRLYSIIYDAMDRHLWRSLFLTLFDDPRGLDRRPASEPNWRNDLQNRVWANRFLTHHAQPIRIQHIRSPQPALCYTHPPAPTSGSEHLRALKTVLTVMYTARLDPDLRPMGTPPRAQALDVMDFGFETDTMQTFYAQPRGLWPPSVPPPQPSLNTTWLQNTLSNGLRASSNRQVALDDIDDSEDWHETEEGLAAGQIISHLGFLPIQTVESDVEPVAETAIGTLAGGHLNPADRSSDVRLATEDMTVEMQRKRAHWHARQRVFNFDYLSRKRRWGPYLPVHPKKARPHSAAGPTQPAEDSDSDEPEWLPGTDAPGAAKVPPANLLRPDWSWLAAARIVAECTLRRAHRKLGLEILGTWDNVREGTWVPTSTVDGTGNPAESLDSNTRASQSTPPGVNTEGSCKTLHERDWAGVEGVWRRLVCWLGYTDLVYYYQNGKYDDPDLQEVYIILSLSLRITGYSPSSIPEYSDRPDIHVEGEMGDAGGEGNVFLGAYNPRRVHGTVSMLASGSVRYSFISANDDNTVDQWSSEAIQLGGVGSAMGALGMWTGVHHESGDPLGVIWQWRVD